jgi:hypothetical protein
MVLDDRSMLVEQRRCVERLIELASAAGDVAALRHGHNIGIVAAFSAGDIAAIERHRIELTRTAHVLREPHGLWAETTWRSSVALLHGRLREAEELSEEAFGLGLSAGVPDTRAMAMFGGQLMELRRLQGRLDELSGVADSMGGGSELSVWDYGLALIAAESEPVDETAAGVEALVAGGGPFEHGVGWGASAAVCVMLADRAGRADLCERIIVDTAAFGDRLASSGAASTGPMSLFLGRAARAAGDLERSITWLHQAADHARRMAAPVSEAEATIELAAALQLDGADPSHVERLLDDAVGVALDRGAAGLVARADDVAAGCR